MSKQIFATNNPDAYALVDDDVFEIIKDMKLKFCILPSEYFYSTKQIQLPGMMKRKCLLLHRFVFTLKNGEEPTSTVDHIDRNKSNNQFSNLRLATIQEQSQHQGRRKSNTSGFTGVCHKHNKLGNGYDYWYSSIVKPDGRREQKQFPYTDEGKIAAAKYYDKKAIEYHGEFHGELNFPSHDN